MNIPTVRNEDLEKQILASALVSDSALDEFAHRIDEDDFNNIYLMAICRELKKCASKGYTPDIILMSSKLGEEYQNIFAQLITVVATTDNIKEQCRKLKEVTLARKVASTAYKIVMASNNITDHHDFSKHSMHELTNLGLDYTEGKLEHISNSFGKAIKEFEAVVKGEEVGFKTGIADIDNQTNGFRKGEYIVLAGRPAQGKTSLALSMMKNMALKNIKVGMFSLEMTSTEVVFKLSSMLSGSMSHVVPLSTFRGITEAKQEHLDAFTETLTKMTTMNMHINDSARTTILDIEVELRRFIKTTGVDVVFIDYIGLIGADSMDGRKRHELIQGFSLRLKNLFKELEVAGIVIVQLNRDSHNKKPNMSNLAESSQIERDAHMIYLLWQPDLEDPTKKMLIGDKGRGVAGGIFPMHFSTQTTEFWSMTQTEADFYSQELSGGEENKWD